MLSVAIFTFCFDRFSSCPGRQGMASVVDSTCRVSLTDIGLPDPRLAEFVRMNTLLSFLI